MYTYRRHQNYQSIVDYLTRPLVKAIHPKIRIISHIITLLVFIIGVLTIKVTTSAVYANGTRNIASTDELIYSIYVEKVDQATDIAQLTSQANKLLEKNMPLYASVKFKRASDLDNNYRDAAYGWGYALLRSTQQAENILNEHDLAELHLAISRTERIDPFYLPLLELKLLVAEIENNSQVIEDTKKRIDDLSHVNSKQ